MGSDDAADRPGSRKRSADVADDYEKKHKDYRRGDDADDVQLKILIPNSVTGAIIGKGGDTRNELQKQYGIGLRTSKANEFYPDTRERILLIKGSVTSIMGMLRFLVTEVYEKANMAVAGRDMFDCKDADRSQELKVLITNSSAGIVIGKGGSFLKEIRETSGGFVKVFPKSENPQLPERVATIVGSNQEALLSATEMVLEKIGDDRNNAMFPNTSYSDVPMSGSDYYRDDYSQDRSGGPQRPHPDFSPRNQHNDGLQFNAPPHRQNMDGPQNRHNNQAMIPSYMGGPVFDIAPDYSRQFSEPRRMPEPPERRIPEPPAPPVAHGTGNVGDSGFFRNLEATLRGVGYNDIAIAEISLSLQTLAKHSLLGLGLGGGLASLVNRGPVTSSVPPPGIQVQSNTSMGPPSESWKRGPVVDSVGLFPHNAATENNRGYDDRPGMGGARRDERRSYDYGHGAASKPMGDGGSRAMGGGGPRAMEDGGSRAMGGGGPRAMEDGGSRAVGDGSSRGFKESTVPIPERYVGAIIGKDAKTLFELKALTRANITVSPKGVYLPGTTERIVTISGSEDCVELARRVVERQISEEAARDASGGRR